MAKMIKKFEVFLNELQTQSATAPIMSDGGEPSYNYGYISDVLGSKYNFWVKNEELTNFEKKVLSKDNKIPKNDDYFVKRYVEHKRTANRLTPPFQDDLISNNDFFAKSFYDEMDAKNDKGEPIRTNEIACATPGNVSGMGAVVSPQAGSVPGTMIGATTGSGDIGSGWSPSVANNANRNIIKRPVTSRKKKKAMSALKNFANQYKAGEYKEGGSRGAILSFSDYTKSKKS